MSNGQLSLPRERATEGFERSRKDNSIFLIPRHFRQLFTEKERGRFTEEMTCKSGSLCRNEKGSISQDINAKSILLV